jgi:hypothetical protein
MGRKENQALLHAAEEGNLGAVKRALVKGANLEAKDTITEGTALVVAAGGGHTIMVKHLLAIGAKVNAHSNGWSALSAACSHGDKLEIVELLLKEGADWKKRFYGRNMLMHAAQGGNPVIVKRMLSVGLDPQELDEGLNAADMAFDGQKSEALKVLQDAGVQPRQLPIQAKAKAIAKLLGGKYTKERGGYADCLTFFEVKCTVEGVKTIVRVGADVNEVVLPEFKPHALTGDAKQLPIYLTLNKRFTTHGKDKDRELAAKSVRSDTPIYASSKLAEEEAVRFCELNQDLFHQLRIQGRERLRVSLASIVLRQWSDDLHLLQERIGILREFFMRNSRTADKEKGLWDKEVVVKIAKKVVKQKPLHQFGGSEDEPVRCSDCGMAAHLMAQINLTDPLLAPQTLGISELPVFWCLNCLEWDVRFYDLKAKPIRMLGGSQSKLEELKQGGETPMEMKGITLAELPTGKKAGSKSKLGGLPKWIQEPATPECPQCQRSMEFAMQLDSNGEIAFADMGMLYGFVCPKCLIGASLIQSH